MKLRAATLHDLDALHALGQAMHAESPRFSQLTYDAGKVDALLRNAVHDSRYFTLVAAEEDGEIIGAFVGFMMEHWCSTDQVAQDISIFVRPDRRGGILAARLAKAFIYWAQDRGAKQIVLGISTGVKVEETAKLYKSLGLKQFGYLFEV